MTSVLNIKKYRHLWGPGMPWPDNWLYVGRANVYLELRGSKWANPFVLHKEADREHVLQSYKEYIVRNQSLMDDLHEIDDKILVCYCFPKRCHGNILIELREEQKRA